MREGRKREREREPGTEREGEIRWGREDWFPPYRLKRRDNAEITLLPEQQL